MADTYENSIPVSENFYYEMDYFLDENTKISASMENKLIMQLNVI